LVEGIPASSEAGENAALTASGILVEEPILTGLIGTHIHASRSPEMHMREADAQNLRLVYKLFDLAESESSFDELRSTLDAVERAGFSGVNITHPFKQSVIELLDELSVAAREIGAVNTVLFRSGRRIGYNTDCFGFEESFKRQLAGASLEKAVQLGAGGAGAATAAAMLHLGCENLCIYDHDASRAHDLMDRFAGSTFAGRMTIVQDVAADLHDASGLINATPVGMETHPGTPITHEFLRPEMWVADVVYFPLETQLLREARDLGCRTADGGQMAVFQAARAFHLFTGRPADSVRMAAEFRRD
jgi:shikimate dehydrogenase